MKGNIYLVLDIDYRKILAKYLQNSMSKMYINNKFISITPRKKVIFYTHMFVAQFIFIFICLYKNTLSSQTFFYQKYKIILKASAHM